MLGVYSLLLAIVVMGPSPIACSLNLTRVQGGVLRLTQGKAFRQVAQAVVYVVVDSTEDESARNQMRATIERTASSLHQMVQHFDGHSMFGQLIVRRLQSLDVAQADERRQKRGLIDIVGDAANVLFGVARQTDIDKVTRAINTLRGQTAALVTLEEKQLAAIDAMKKNQRQIASRLTDTLARVNQQSVQLQQMGRILEEEAHYLHHLEIRQRILLLVDNFVDDIAALAAMTSAAQHRRHLCEGRLVTEDLLPRHALIDLLDNPINDARFPLEWYYTHLTAESMFIINSTIVCKVRIPLVNAIPLKRFDVITLPVPNVNASGYFRLFHNAKIAVSTANDEILFEENCIGNDPVVCPGTARFPIAQFPCIRGIIDDDPTQQHKCPVTYLRQPSAEKHLHQIDDNVYAGYLDGLDYYYRCSERKPLYGRLDAAPYIIELDADCTLDTGSLILSGTRETSAKIGFEQPRMHIVEISNAFADAPWRNVSHYARDFPHLEELKLASIGDIPDSVLSLQLGEMKNENVKRHLWFKSWWFWITLIGLLSSGVFATTKYARVLRKRWPCHPPGLQREELANPRVEIPQPRQSNRLYPPLSPDENSP